MDWRFWADAYFTMYEEPNFDAASRTLYFPDDYSYSGKENEDAVGYVNIDGTWYYCEDYYKNGSVGSSLKTYAITIVEYDKEEEGAFLEEVRDADQNKYPQNGVKDGYWYRYTGTITNAYYVSTATEIEATPAHRGATLPTLDRQTGLFSFGEEGTGVYGWDDNNSYYYVVADDKTFKITVSTFVTEAYELTNYIGLSALNGSYYQILKGSSYIKGNPTGNRVESTNRDDYPDDGIKDGKWYAFVGTSEASGYIWKKYNLSTIDRITYHWNKYNASYSWNKYTYTEKDNPDISSLDKTRWQKLDTVSVYKNVQYKIQCEGVDVSDKFTISVLPSSTPGLIVQGGSAIIPFKHSATGKLTLVPVIGGTALELQAIYGENETSVKLYFDTNGLLYMFVSKEYTKGDYIETVSSANKDEYPNGVKDGFYYEFYERTPGEQIDQINSLNPNEITEGWDGDFYYASMPSTTEQIESKGDYVEEVESEDRSSYPTNGKSGDYWYIFDRIKTDRTKGEYIGTVSSTDENEYPNPGMDANNWWYEDRTLEVIHRPNILVGLVYSEEEDTYPEDGEKDGYYFVVDPKAISTHREKPITA